MKNKYEESSINPKIPVLVKHGENEAILTQIKVSTLMDEYVILDNPLQETTMLVVEKRNEK